MRILNFLKEPEKASTADLETQVEQAVAALGDARVAAESAKDLALADASGEKAYIAARSKVELAEARLEKAHALLEQRHREEEAAERVRDQERLAELSIQMQAARNKAHDLHEPTAEALFSVVQTFAAQLEHDNALDAMEREYSRIAASLGNQGDFHEISTGLASARPKPHAHVVLRLFDDQVRKLAEFTPAWWAAKAIKEELLK